MLSSNFHSIRQAWVPFLGAPSALVSWGWQMSTPSGRELTSSLSQVRECLGSLGREGAPLLLWGQDAWVLFRGDPQFLFSRATLPESCLGVQPAPVFMGVRRPRPPGRGTLGPHFPKAPPPQRTFPGSGAHMEPLLPTHPQCPSPSDSAGRRREHRSQSGPHPGRPQAGRPCARQLPGARLPAPPSLPAPRAPPDLGMRAGAVATNERACRLREPGRLCPPGIGHAVGSGGRGLGGPRAWLGQACCWVTGRRVSPGNGGGYRSLAGRGGGGARRRQAPQTPATARCPRPAGSGNLHTRRPLGPRGRRRPPPSPHRLRSSPPGFTVGGAGEGDAGDPPSPLRGKPGPRPCSEKLSPPQLPLAVPRNPLFQKGPQEPGEGRGSAGKELGHFFLQLALGTEAAPAGAPLPVPYTGALIPPSHFRLGPMVISFAQMKKLGHREGKRLDQDQRFEPPVWPFHHFAVLCVPLRGAAIQNEKLCASSETPPVAGPRATGLKPPPQPKGHSLKSWFRRSESQEPPSLVVGMLGNVSEAPTRPQCFIFIDLLTAKSPEIGPFVVPIHR